jgi:hypothetical protein
MGFGELQKQFYEIFIGLDDIIAAIRAPRFVVPVVLSFIFPAF